MYVAYTSPHWPLHALREDIDKYQGRYAKGWDVVRNERYQRMLQLELFQKTWYQVHVTLKCHDGKTPNP